MSGQRFYKTLLLLSLCTLIRIEVQAQQKTLKVLSYNVLKGLQADTANKQRFTDWVKSKSPDIIFYQEMNDFTQKSLENFAMGYGHPYAVIAKESGYSVAITSRFPIVNAQKVLDNMWHGYLHAYTAGIHVFAIHLSPFRYKKRQYEIKQILAHAESLPKGSQVIIAGDFNSYQPRDSSYYNQKHLLAQRKREQDNAEIQNLNQGEFDYSVIREVERAEYKDAVNLFSTKFNYTMPTIKYDARFKQKVRIDYVWLDKELQKKVLSATVLYDEDTAEMSDHYPIWLTLKY
jgi:exodeoxyribonuclease-3